MSSFKRLVREIHRRSLWQVVGLFGAVSWGVLQVVEVVTESVGLPDWTPGMAFVLLLIGLPIVVATAFVQEGMPGQEEEAVEEADETAGRENLADGTGSLDLPSPRPPKIQRLLTWRNAVIGGVAAFALLGFTVVAYWVMWSTGIGPVGNLEAQGVFDEREPVVLADFAVTTTDPGVGRLVTEALRVDLVESSALSVLPESYIADAKRRMDLAPEASLTPEVAREIARRDGIKAVIQGEIGALGGGYVLTASLVAAETGRALAAFRETVEDEGRLIAAIDKLSERIRAKAGESLRQIRSGEALEEVTTSSLEALEAYTEAIALHNAGREQEGIALLESALELDPEFGMAWRKLAVLLQNSAGDPERVRHAVRRAFELRERMSETERWLAEAYYFTYLEDDEQRTIQAYERVLDANPDDPVALNNLALRLTRSDIQRARELLERAVNGPGATFVAHQNLLGHYWSMGREDEARAFADRFLARYPDNPIAQSQVASLLTMEGRFAEAHDRHVEIRESPGISAGRRAFMEMQIASEDVGLGRIDEARAHIDEALRLAETSDQPSWAVEAHGQWAITNATLGLEAAAVHRAVDRALELLPITGMSTNGWTEANQISALALAGAVDRAAALLAEYDREWPPSSRDLDRRMSHLWMEWALAYARGEWDQALVAIDALQRELNCDAARCWGWWERGRTLEAAGRHDEAREMYARSLDGTAMTEVRWYPIWSLDALERMGRLADEAGDTARALEAYRRFAELWADADPELRPRVERARARIAALGG